MDYASSSKSPTHEQSIIFYSMRYFVVLDA